MPKAAKPAAPMSVAELLLYTIDVMGGKLQAGDSMMAQPIGPAEDMTQFWTLLGIISAINFVAILGFEAMGFYLGRSLGLKGGKVGRFSASFVELVYYSFSLTLGFVANGKFRWFWPDGWGDVMHDGRNQLIKGLAPYHVAREFTDALTCAIRRLPNLGLGAIRCVHPL